MQEKLLLWLTFNTGLALTGFRTAWPGVQFDCSLSMPFDSHLQCLKKARHSSYAKNKYPALEDVTLYYFSQQRFFYRFYSMVRITCLSQFIFWGWMACFQIRKRSQEKILVVSSSSSNPGVSRKIDSHFMVSIN